MKKTLSILLLVIFSFNLGGYYLFFWALKQQANQELSAKLDAGHYNESETFEIQIPISLPYPLQSNGFERQYGQFTYQGEQYQVVKQKYENDVLTMVCLKDAKATHIEKISDAFAETSSTPIQEGSLNLPLKVFQDYISNISTFASSIEGWSRSIHQNTPYFSSSYQVDLTAFVPPPWA